MLEPGAEFGGYRIEGVLGRGGMGTVYEATQLSLQRRVALKVLSEELSAEPVVRERFRREALLQAGIEHPHIVTVYEAGEVESRAFIAMRMITGPTLRQLIRLAEASDAYMLALLAQVADALDAAHRVGLVHRDIKPANVLVDARDHAYLADFGITKSIDDTTLTRTGQFVGTPHYLAPEQVMGERATAASDVYALAAVVFECLTGQAPFAMRDSTPAILFAHVNVEPPRVSEQRPDLPSGVDDAIASGLSKDPAERPPSPSALVGEVERALGGAATATTRPTRVAGHPMQDASTTGERRTLRRPSRLRWAPAAVLLAAVGIGVAALAISDGSSDTTGGRSPPGQPAGAPVSPSGSVITIGSALREAGEPTDCTGGGPEACTITQTALPRRILRSPFERGVITRWRVRSSSGQVAISVLRGRDPERVVRSSGFTRVSGARIREVAARLPIARGEAIALEVEEGTKLGVAYTQGAGLERWSPPMGSSGAQKNLGPSGLEILLNADVERDRDGDGYGDDSQDECPEDPRRHAGC